MRGGAGLVGGGGGSLCPNRVKKRGAGRHLPPPPHTRARARPHRPSPHGVPHHGRPAGQPAGSARAEEAPAHHELPDSRCEERAPSESGSSGAAAAAAVSGGSRTPPVRAAPAPWPAVRQALPSSHAKHWQPTRAPVGADGCRAGGGAAPPPRAQHAAARGGARARACPLPSRPGGSDCPRRRVLPLPLPAATNWGSRPPPAPPTTTPGPCFGWWAMQAGGLRGGRGCGAAARAGGVKRAVRARVPAPRPHLLPLERARAGAREAFSLSPSSPSRPACVCVLTYTHTHTHTHTPPPRPARGLSIPHASPRAFSLLPPLYLSSLPPLFPLSPLLHSFHKKATSSWSAWPTTPSRPTW